MTNTLIYFLTNEPVPARLQSAIDNMKPVWSNMQTASQPASSGQTDHRDPASGESADQQGQPTNREFSVC